MDTSYTWYVPVTSPPRHDRHAVREAVVDHEALHGGTPHREPSSTHDDPAHYVNPDSHQHHTRTHGYTDIHSVQDPRFRRTTPSARALMLCLFAHPPLWHMDLVNFCRSSQLRFAMPTMSHLRLGRKGNWTRWSGVRRTRTRDLPTKQ